MIDRKELAKMFKIIFKFHGKKKSGNLDNILLTNLIL
jgi:hypothetical protein